MKIPTKLHTAVVLCAGGNTQVFHGATEQRMIESLAVFCRDRWGECMPKPPESDEGMVIAYFRLYQADTWTHHEGVTTLDVDVAGTFLSPGELKLSEEAWETLFKPVMRDDAYRQFEHGDVEDAKLIEAARAANTLWTQVDGDDGQWCMVSGWHYVNRNYYVICGIPYPADLSISVVDEDTVESEEESEQAEA